MINYIDFKKNLCYVNNSVKLDISYLSTENNFINKNKSGNRYYLSIPKKFVKDYVMSELLCRDINELIKLNNLNAKIEGDYINIDGKLIKIGKFIKKYGDEFLLDCYKIDRNSYFDLRGKKIVISNHPYDVMGASTDRNWTSCIDLHDKKYNGEYIGQLHYINLPIIYIIDENDNNISKPHVRISSSIYSCEMKGVDISNDFFNYIKNFFDIMKNKRVS